MFLPLQIVILTPEAKPKRPLDQAWELCVQLVQGETNKQSAIIVSTIMYGGINRLKHHHTRVVCKDVLVCDGFPK